jgi:hypothetical protein
MDPRAGSTALRQACQGFGSVRKPKAGSSSELRVGSRRSATTSVPGLEAAGLSTRRARGDRTIARSRSSAGTLNSAHSWRFTSSVTSVACERSFPLGRTGAPILSFTTSLSACRTSGCEELSKRCALHDNAATGVPDDNVLAGVHCARTKYGRPQAAASRKANRRRASRGAAGSPRRFGPGRPDRAPRPVASACPRRPAGARTAPPRRRPRSSPPAPRSATSRPDRRPAQ